MTADVVDRATRSRMMSGIRGVNTRPEITIRKALFARGFRYRLHQRGLPGKPDIVLAKYRAVVFVHGCFWHGHGCRLFKWPKTRREFWRVKIEGNRATDERNLESLLASGWRVATVWECAIKGKRPEAVEQVVGKVEKWLQSNRRVAEFVETA